MGHGVRWGRDHQIRPKVTTFHPTDRCAVSRTPSPMAHPPEAACACPQAADTHISALQIVAGNHAKQAHRLRPADRASQQRDAPVEGAGGSALSSVRERIRRSGERGLERACARAGGDRALEHTGGGKERPLTRLRRVEKSSKSSSSCPRRHREGARGRTLRPAQRERVERTSKATRFSLCDRNGW